MRVGSCYAHRFLSDISQHGLAEVILVRRGQQNEPALPGFVQDTREASCSPTCLPPGSWPVRGSALSDASSAGPEDTAENQRTIMTTARTHQRTQVFKRKSAMAFLRTRLLIQSTYFLLQVENARLDSPGKQSRYPFNCGGTCDGNGRGRLKRPALRWHGSGQLFRIMSIIILDISRPLPS